MFNWLINFFKVKNVEYPPTPPMPEPQPVPEVKVLNLASEVKPIDNTTPPQSKKINKPSKSVKKNNNNPRTPQHSKPGSKGRPKQNHGK